MVLRGGACPAQGRGGEGLPAGDHLAAGPGGLGPGRGLAGGAGPAGEGRPPQGGGIWSDLRRETVRLGLLAEPALGEATLQGIAGKLNQEELEALQACYTRRLEGAAPCRCSCTTAGRQPRRGGGGTAPS